MSDLTRRGLLIGGATVAAVALTPEIAYAHESDDRTRTVPFTLNATTLDGGEQITSLTLDVPRGGRFDFDPRSLTTKTFTVHVKASRPFDIGTDMIFGEADVDRTVTGARFEDGRIVLDLYSGFYNPNATGVPGAGTLGYLLRAARNVRLSLVYTITQVLPLRERNKKPVTLPGFVQGKLVNPEVDAYSYGKSATGMNYRLFTPRDRSRSRKPLIIWFHGGGEGGTSTFNYYDNEAPLRANRGALGFSGRDGQRIFGDDGAYVLAPQAESAWMSDGPGYAPRLKALIDKIVATHPIDASRIYVVGCSNGGFMSLYMTSAYPKMFAGSVPICPGASTRYFTDAQLTAITTPTWMVASKADTTLPPATNALRALPLIAGAKMSLYENVTWDGVLYNGHWSWIYVAHNDPTIDRQHVYQWMAKQRLSIRR